MSVKYLVLRSNGVTTEVVSTVQREDNSEEFASASSSTANQKLLILSEASSRVRDVRTDKRKSDTVSLLSQASVQNGDLFPTVFFANSSGEVAPEDILFDHDNVGAQIVTGAPPQSSLDEQIVNASATYNVKSVPGRKKSGDSPKHQCDICFKVFPSSSNLKRHYRIHTGEKPFQCKVCNKAYAQIDHLKRHLGVHSDENSYKCELCGKSYREKTRYVIHMRSHTGERPFACGICGKTFTYKVGLMKHRKVHTGERKYECSYCLKRFTESQTVRVHERIHTGERPYVCKFCGRGFSVKKGLRIHVRTHTGEKPFSCDVCWRKFVSKSGLNTHKKSHLSVYPFSCKFCGKTFPIKGALRVHVRTHLKEKPFECTVCLKRFARKINLDQHMKLHEDVHMTCGECGAAFLDFDSCEAHVKAHELNTKDPVVLEEPGDDTCENLIGNALDTLARATQIVEETSLTDLTENMNQGEFPDRGKSFLVMEILEKHQPRKRARRNSV